MSKLIDRVLVEIQRDFDMGDLTAIEELLSFVPRENLIGYLPEEEWGDDVKKKDEIGSLLIDIFDRIGIVTPSNFEDILQYVFEDVSETADPVDWNDDDVAIGFRRWIESNEQK